MQTVQNLIRRVSDLALYILTANVPKMRARLIWVNDQIGISCISVEKRSYLRKTYHYKHTHSGTLSLHLVIFIIELFALCKGGNLNIHIWAWFGYFIC